MLQYVALLRGINVGGNSIIKMDALSQEFVKMGFFSVKTYIASGNVLFESDENDADKLENAIESALDEAFHYRTKVFIRSKEQMRVAVDSFPEIFASSDWKHNVIFLSKELDNPQVVESLHPKEDIETVTYVPGALFWSARMDSLTRSVMIKLSSRPEYQEMTVRNMNTVRKILELMK